LIDEVVLALPIGSQTPWLHGGYKSGRLLDLAFLPTALVEDIVAGRQSVEMTVETLSRAERPQVWAGT